MPRPSSARPDPTAELTTEEFQRWYWLKDELADFARDLGIRATGSKELLSARISARLSGLEFIEPAVQLRGGGRQLSGELTPSTVIPAGQRCSQVVRAWMTERVGGGFHFDAEMRAFFGRADGTTTLNDALELWRSTRDQPRQPIDQQFEYNRFTRAWHEENPDGTRDALLAAWWDYRARPVDQRGRT